MANPSTTEIVGAIASAVAPTVSVGIAATVAFVAGAWVFRSFFERLAQNLEDDKRLREAADKFGWAGSSYGLGLGEDDALERLREMNESFDADDEAAQDAFDSVGDVGETHSSQWWSDHYVEQLELDGWSREDAIASVARTNEEIDEAVELVRSGWSVEDAVSEARHQAAQRYGDGM